MRSMWIAVLLVGLLAATLAARGVEYPGETMRLTGHTDAAMSAAVSPDGKVIATAAVDGVAILWDAATGRAVRRLEGHAQGLTAVAFSADGARVVTASLDRTARVWDAGSGELVAILRGAHGQHLHGAAISADGSRVLTASCDHSVVLWDVAAERPLHRLRQDGEAHGVAFAPDGKTFLAGSRPRGNNPDEKTLRLYDTATGALVHAFAAGIADRIVFVAGGKRALVAGDMDLQGFDLDGRRVEPPPFGKRSGSTEIAVSADGRRLVVGSKYDAIVYDLEAGKGLGRVESSGEWVRAVAVAPDGAWAVIGGGGMGEPWIDGYYKRSADTDVKVVTLTPAALDPAARPTPARLAKMLAATAAGGDGGGVVFGAFYGEGGTVWWDAASGAEFGRAQLPLPPAGRFVAAVSGDGGRAAVYTGNTAGTVFDRSGKIVGRVRDPNPQVSAVALSADGASAFTAAARTRAAPGAPRPVVAEAEIRQFEVATGKELRTFTGPAGVATEMVVSRDGRTLLALFGDPHVGETAAVAYDVATGKQLWTWSPPAGSPPRAPLARAAVDADGGTAVVGLASAPRLVDLRAGKELVGLKGLTTNVGLTAFDPDGRHVWTTGVNDAEVRCWDRKDGRQVRTVRSPIRPRSFHFRDGRRFVLGVEDGKLFEHPLDP